MRSAPHTLRRFIVVFALLALALRSLIPTGYMPDFSAHARGWIPLIVCDGFEHIVEKEPSEPCPEHAQHHHDHKHHHGGLCPFGASSVVSYEPIDIQVGLTRLSVAILDTPFTEQARKELPVFSNASPRSPPFFS